MLGKEWGGGSPRGASGHRHKGGFYGAYEPLKR